MQEEKNSFIVFTDIKEILDDLDDKQVAALFRGMVDYQETGEDDLITMVAIAKRGGASPAMQEVIRERLLAKDARE